MFRLFVSLIGVMALIAPAIAGQDERAAAAEHQQPKQAEQPAQSKAKPTGPADEAAKADPTARGGQFANVRLEVTISDQRASGPPTTKTVALVLADRANGRIRTTGEVRVPNTGHVQPLILNVDAQPHVLSDNKVRASVTLEYKPTVGAAASEDQALTTVSESFAVILDDGKPLVVSQSADPSTDRRVRVEVKATILK